MVLCRSVAQAVSPWFPIAADRRRVRIMSCGIFGGKIRTWAGFLQLLRFPLPITPPTAPQSPASTIRGWSNRPNSCRRTKCTQLYPIPQK
jgi:hypothetical protein